ncbi:cell division protein FtsQ [Moraxella macacae 0408225]|uniref:Cell division protein FtsQ n=1 Tax=Moraxella macacae 0408225 TaxID=1230338 RepID=L2F9A5_9GAMM|nr:cell division protein FtsQ/DivIB [Moraxella macacae]ELA09639.1 cell division protein FtsQ [Moraxella macacae 0408225]
MTHAKPKILFGFDKAINFDKKTLTNPLHWLLVGVFVLFLVFFVLIVQLLKQLPNAAINVLPDGLNPYEHQVLLQTVGMQATDNFLQTDLQSYVDKISHIDWVEQVDIRRDWQKGLVVKVIPRQAVAKFGSERLVDSHGVVFYPADLSELNADYWMHLQGDDNKDAIAMMQQAKQVSDWYLPLGLKVDEVIVTSRMTWLFRFDNGLRVLVNNDNTSEKLYRLSVLLQNQLNPKLAKIQSIDLRYKNGMAITWRPVVKSETVVTNKKSNRQQTKL